MNSIITIIIASHLNLNLNLDLDLDLSFNSNHLYINSDPHADSAEIV